ncbi:MAG: alcohol dehydrogenase, partial [Nakamurella sp.]
RSVTSNTRQDGIDFLDLAGRHHLKVSTVPYSMTRADGALADLAAGRVTGAAVLVADW